VGRIWLGYRGGGRHRRRKFYDETRCGWCRFSVFHATVVADAAEQPEGRIGRGDLRKLPIIYPPEEALPHGDGEPGAQISLPGFEPVIEGKR